MAKVSADEPASLIDVAKAATILGVERWQIYDLVSAGELPAVRISRGAIRFVETDVRDFAEVYGDPDLISTDRVAQLLGVSTRTVHRLAADGEIPSERRRGSLRFRKSDVEAFVASRRVGA